MLKTQLATKQDLLKIIQAANIKKVSGADIDDRNDLKNFMKSSEAQLNSSDQLTMILITTAKGPR